VPLFAKLFFASSSKMLQENWPDQRRIEPCGKAIDPATTRPEQRSEQEWLDLEQVAKVEVTSENPNLPIESALASGKGPGWRCIKTGTFCSYLLSPVSDPGISIA